jgi:hypothetical protein
VASWARRSLRHLIVDPDELKTIADQLGHFSVVLTADTYLSVAVELGLKSAADAARLVLKAGKRPPGGGDVRRRDAPYSSKSPSDSSGTIGTRRRRRVSPPCPNDPEDSDNANPARQLGLQYVRSQKQKLCRPEAGPTLDPPWSHQLR